VAVGAGCFASTSGVTTFASSVLGDGCRSGGACGTGCPSRKFVIDGSEGAALGSASLGACSITTEAGGGVPGACAFSVSAVLAISELVDAGSSLDGPQSGALTGSLGSACAGAFATSLSVLFPVCKACCFHTTAMETEPAISMKVAAPAAAERQKLLRALARWRANPRS